MTFTHDELVRLAAEAIERDWGHSATVEDMAAAVIAAIGPVIEQAKAVASAESVAAFAAKDGKDLAAVQVWADSETKRANEKGRVAQHWYERCLIQEEQIAELERRVAAIEPEMDAMRAVITEAALETYEPDGAEIVASHMIQQQQEIAELRRMVAAARAEGWDEGYYRGTRDAERDQEPADNPYRTEEV